MPGGMYPLRHIYCTLLYVQHIICENLCHCMAITVPMLLGQGAIFCAVAMEMFHLCRRPHGRACQGLRINSHCCRVLPWSAAHATAPGGRGHKPCIHPCAAAPPTTVPTTGPCAGGWHGHSACRVLHTLSAECHFLLADLIGLTVVIPGP